MENKQNIKDIISHAMGKTSSFSFEMEILNIVKTNSFICNHSGKYLDPQKNIIREFDIRAFKKITKNIENDTGFIHIKLALECKNISEKNPLIIYSTKMEEKEKFHTIIKNVNKSQSPKPRTLKVQNTSDRCNYYNTLYHCIEYIGKSMDQLKNKSNKYFLEDNDIYSKFSQAQSSLSDLVKDGFSSQEEIGNHFFIIIPVLVLPNNTLYEQSFGDQGNRIELKETNRIPFYLNLDYEISNGTDNFKHLIQFMEIVTKDGLNDLLKILTTNDPFNKSNPAFPEYLFEVPQSSNQDYPNACLP